MALQKDYQSALGKGTGGGRIWAWNTSSQKAMLMAFSLMTLCLILLLSWENTTPHLASNGILPIAQSLIQYNFAEADREKSNAISELTRPIDGSGDIMRTAWKSVSEDLDADPEGTRTKGGAEPVDASITRKNEHPTRNASNLSASPSTTQHSRSGNREGPSKSEANSSVAVTRQLDQRIKSKGTERKLCDFTKGQWVKNDRRPFYSGNECKAYLSGGFACRQMNRPDFGYENRRWQPEGCDLPSFSGKGILDRLRNGVVAFIGDSLGRQQFQSFMCMLTEGKDAEGEVENVESLWGPGVKWAHRFRATNTTVLFHWNSALCDIELGNPNELPGHSAMHLDRPDSFMKDNLHRLDVVVLNTGHHWNRGKMESNRWHLYVDGKRNTDRKLAGMAEAYNYSVHKVMRWLDAELAGYSMRTRQPTVFMRTLSPRHFKNGEWNSGGTCDATQYVAPSKAPAAANVPYTGPVTELVAENAVKDTRVTLLNITHLSKFREEAHISKYGMGQDSTHQDCLHWCLPGVPDVWNEILYGHLMLKNDLSPSRDALVQ